MGGGPYVPVSGQWYKPFLALARVGEVTTFEGPSLHSGVGGVTGRRLFGGHMYTCYGPQGASVSPADTVTGPRTLREHMGIATRWATRDDAVQFWHRHAYE
jgi:hypothetical protein